MKLSIRAAGPKAHCAVFLRGALFIAIVTTEPMGAQPPWLAGSASATSYQPVLPVYQLDPNATGIGGTYNANGPTVAASNPFFQPLGTNGRTCATCHQPANSMSISVASVQRRYLETAGLDALFEPVDGANCPDAVQSPFPYLIGDPNNPRSLLLNRALIRIGLAWPPAGVKPEFTIKVVSDPTRCELSPTYGIKSKSPTVSVYRRSLMAANLKYVTTVGPGVTVPGQILPTDPYTGLPESGNIMFDGREPTLQRQAMDALLTHAQASTLPSAAVIQQIVNFENGIYTAQAIDNQAQYLADAGALGGPLTLLESQAGVLSNPNTFSIYAPWAALSIFQPFAAQRESVARGEAIFNTRTFTVSNVVGINDLIGGSVPGTCSFCHSGTFSGNDARPQAQLNVGTTGGAFALPAPDLPLFQLTCAAGKSQPFNGSVITVRDPGLALITGKCADIGKVKSAQLRGLAARAPYFHDGSAGTLRDVVNFYNSRFNIRFTQQEITDLLNFLQTL